MTTQPWPPAPTHMHSLTGSFCYYATCHPADLEVWRHTLVHQPAHMSSYRPMGWPSPIKPKYSAGPMSLRLNARFMPHMGKSVPCHPPPPLWRTFEGQRLGPDTWKARRRSRGRKLTEIHWWCKPHAVFCENQQRPHYHLSWPVLFLSSHYQAQHAPSIYSAKLTDQC